MPVAAKQKKAIGRPTKYQPEKNRLVAKMARHGFTRYEIARMLGITWETLLQWQVAHPGFAEALKPNADMADDRAERGLYERAVGYDYPAEELVTWKGEVVTRTTVMKHVPPDVGACIFWLKNRRGDRWRDRQEIQHSFLYNFVGMVPSDEEWIERYGSNPEPLVIDQRPKEQDMDTNPDPDDVRHGGAITEKTEKKGNGSGNE